MRKLLLSLPLLAGFAAMGQNVNELNKTDVENSMKVKVAEVKPDSLKKWKVGANVNVNFTNTGLKNWQGGGQDALTLTGVFTGFANYVNGLNQWSNLLEAGYGITKISGVTPATRKSDDRLVFTSKYTRKLHTKWGFTGLCDFRTQFYEGVKYDKYKPDGVNDRDTTIYISNFLAPAFMVTSLGFEYKPEGDMFYAMISPVTSKVTIVNSPYLSSIGSFGVKPGDKLRSEFGAYLNTAFKYKLMENIEYKTNLNLFMNYKTPELIDVFWDNAILLTVNKFITASFNTNLIYDDDVKITQSDGSAGPRIQFKHVLAVGLTVKLK